MKHVLITNQDEVEIGEHTRIDDFVKIVGKGGVKIGDYVHISSFCSVIGGGEFIMEDFSGLSCNCHIITGSDDMYGSGMAIPTVPAEYKCNITNSRVIMKKHSALGTGSIVLPGITIGEGAVTLVGTVVNKDLDDWCVYGGNPARKIGIRRKDKILECERKLNGNGN